MFKRILSFLVVGIILHISNGSFARDNGGHPQYKPDELVCEMLPGYDVDIINQTYGTMIKGIQYQTGCYLLMVPPNQDAESLGAVIEERPDVLYCGLNYYLNAPEPYQRSQPFIDIQVVGDLELQSAAQTLNLASALTMSTGDGIRVAIIDAGVDLNHPFFAQSPGEVISRWDYIDNDSLALDEPGGPAYGHGTFIAGIYSLVAPGADIYAYRVLDTAGSGDGYSIAEAILLAIEDSCRVINLSLGMMGVHDAIDEALKEAKRNGIIIIAAAGNDSTNNGLLFPFPAERAYSLAVAALDSMNIKADFSNYGVNIAVCAPGTGIYSIFPDGQYAWWDGTSFAAPFAGGLAALLIASDPEAGWDELMALIGSTAINIDSLNPGLEGQLGSGLIDLVTALGSSGQVAMSGLDCNGNMIDDAIDVLNGTLADTNGDGILEGCVEFYCGDLNADLTPNILDIVYYIDYKFKYGPQPYPPASGDANHDQSLNVVDILLLIDYKFKSGPPPVCW